MASKTLKIIKQYNAKLDIKKRMTIRNSDYDHYEVNVFEDGNILLKPQMLINADELSLNTLKMMDRSILSFKKGKVSKPINYKKYLKI